MVLLSVKMEKQRGVYAVEFAVAALVFFVALFMAIEFGRLLYTWNMLEEVTRRAARLAAVCPVTPVTETEAIRQRARISGASLPDFEPANIEIRYLNADGIDVGDPVANFNAIRFVRAGVVNYQYQALFPLGVLFTAPDFQLTLPSESLGITPPGTGVTTCLVT